MAKVREVYNQLPEGVRNQGRTILKGYYIIGTQEDVDKLFFLNQLPGFRKLIADVDNDNLDPYIQLTFLKTEMIRHKTKKGQLYEDSNYIIGIRRGDHSLGAFQKSEEHNSPLVQNIADAINHYLK